MAHPSTTASTPNPNTRSTPLPSPPSKTTSTSYRKPLSTKDYKNVIMRVVSQTDSAPLTAKSTNPNMPSYDKPNTNRPLAPTLSASANRGNKPKPPLTPKVSARPASRQSRTENTTPNNAKEDLSTPVSTFLNSNNITGRSSTRKIRLDTSSNSPSGTPTSSEAPRLFDHTQNGAGLGISGFEKDTSKRAAVAFSPSNSDLNYSQSSQSSADSKFFFASDVKPQSHSSQQTKPPPPKNASTFFHANGDKVPKKPPPPPRSGGSTVGSTIGEDRGHARFFHANGTPELQLSPSPHFAPPRPSSVLSSHSRMASPRLANATTSPSQRPASPQKLNTQYAPISSVRAPTPLDSPVLPRPKASGRQQLANTTINSRRTSADSEKGHNRATSSGSSMERLLVSRKVSSGGHSINIPNPITIIEPSSPASMAHTDELLEGEEEEEPGESEDEDDDEDDNRESISSEEEAEEEVKGEVLKAGGSIERMNELAAIARNERKVLDLEITNSSLAAINRTLEREMRKQNAELRRYKRLSRSGRFSMATGASSRAKSGNLSVVDEKEGSALSDISQENSELEDEEDGGEEDLTSEEESIDDGTLSPAAVAEHDLKHRKKDEKRLRLDLSKHQQLLIDSQKMNQSLKKCLGWTEELINEGKRALEYRVKTSDIGPLAPRVLAPDELEENDAENDNEGMSAIGASLLREARKAAAEQHKDKGNHLAIPTETDEQLEDLTQDIQFALFASGESAELPTDEKAKDGALESVPIAPPTSPWVSTFTSRLQTRS
ncbi:hypothetical protein SBOR_4772 [Sclerotinia borealis F-4128]|uniref:Uncharacterized protein n=1 Tax=Sclerotinia borealis (strain F-4128) TaxID=1432307 RepID=W9CDJ7_SCLBF|nr:hypothetical protein SBOR_4772 [Sclerotinia borealis F-4128]